MRNCLGPMGEVIPTCSNWKRTFTNTNDKIMKKENGLIRPIMGVAIVTGLLLLIPLVAMQFTDEVNWDALDFAVAGALIFSTGVAYVLVAMRTPRVIYRVALAMGIGITFFMIWANLAVGLIGGGPNAGNLMYAGVVLAGMIVASRSHFRPKGMEYAMYAMAIALGVHTAIALATGMNHYPSSSTNEILGVNGFFAAGFIMAGLVFRYVAREESKVQGS